jgi:hypothetical protein
LKPADKSAEILERGDSPQLFIRRPGRTQCNQRKGNHAPNEARRPLLSNPSALFYGLEKAVMYREAETRPEWSKYLFLEEGTSAVA